MGEGKQKRAVRQRRAKEKKQKEERPAGSWSGCRRGSPGTTAGRAFAQSVWGSSSSSRCLNGVRRQGRRQRRTISAEKYTAATADTRPQTAPPCGAVYPGVPCPLACAHSSSFLAARQTFKGGGQTWTQP